MMPRPEALPLPEGPRYWSVDLGERGAFHFRFPTFATASALLEVVRRRQADLGAAQGELQEVLLGTFSPAAGATVGACWHHRGMLLDSVPPGILATPEEWLAYGERVVSEWVDQDLTLHQLIATHNACYAQLAARLGLVVRAQERASFSAAPTPGEGASGGAGESGTPDGATSSGSPRTSA